jgi:general secretion pathway protein D
LLAGLTGCGPNTEHLALQPLPEVSDNAAAEPRVDGKVGTPEAPPPAQLSFGVARRMKPPPGVSGYAGGGDVSLDFADTDIRAVVAQILGRIWNVNYTIDPGVHGTVTFRTSKPLARAQLVPVLQTLLAQNGATLLHSGRVWRVALLKDAVGASQVASTVYSPGVAVVSLHYASAPQLAKLLQPYIANGGRITAEQGSNAVLVTGDPATRDTLVELVRAFDVDLLAGQSYALLPVTSGDAKDFASSLQDALRAQTNGPMAGRVLAVPMQRIDAVLVVGADPGIIREVRRVYALLQRKQRDTLRSWHVYYLQNSRADDVAYTLQQAFTPNDVTAQPSAHGTGAAPYGAGAQQAGVSTIGLGGTMGGGLLGGVGSGAVAGVGTPGTGGLPGAMPTLGTGTTAQGRPPAASPSGNPLLGGLEPRAGAGEPQAMRIIADAQNNAVLIYGTQQEEDTVEAMLRKVDIIPLQVLIDATVAEVDLNDQLQYGTQFFFKQGGLNGTLAAALPQSAPGFLLAGSNASQVALALLQSVTTVHVLSSPELLVLDNQPAQLQVGDLVPYLTASSQSTLVSGAPIINSVNYMQTGVIMQVTPRVNSGGLVMLDIVQVVSDIDNSVATSIGSPAFLERTVQSRIVVQDGQTVGLAGLIRDNVSRQNQGVPWLKDVPLIGALFGQQSNTRARTEMLVLITPHVVRDQRGARALTEDLREQLMNAALVPQELKHLKPDGSSDPNRSLRNWLHLGCGFTGCKSRNPRRVRRTARSVRASRDRNRARRGSTGCDTRTDGSTDPAEPCRP